MAFQLEEMKTFYFYFFLTLPIFIKVSPTDIRDLLLCDELNHFTDSSLWCLQSQTARCRYFLKPQTSFSGTGN